MTTCLCLIAHPDDETMLCGGTLALLTARGVPVHLLCLTRGEGGELGEPPLTDRDHLGEVRSRELACAARHLGCQPPEFLGYVDPTVGPGETLFAPLHDFDTLTAQIAAQIGRTAATIILTHGTNGEYGHPAHQLIHRAALAAAAAHPVNSQGQPAPLVYSFAASYPGHPYPRLSNADDPADLIVDVSSVLDQKEAAALCHATQTGLFVRRRSEAAGRRLTVREVLLAEESLRRHFPAHPAAADPLLTLLHGSQPASPSPVAVATGQPSNH